MIRTTTIRALSRWIVGLFVVAQIFAVSPLISEHTAHVAQTEFADGHGATADIPHGTHHRGDADGAVQHHAMQDLSGALAFTVHPCEACLVHAAVLAREPAAPTGRDPTSLERPPKTLLSA